MWSTTNVLLVQIIEVAEPCIYLIHVNIIKEAYYQQVPSLYPWLCTCSSKDSI